jgi:hypothetical protein
VKTSKKHEAGVMVGRAMAVTCIFSIVMVSQAFAQENWAQRKCDLYSEGWRWVLQSQDLNGVRQTFIQGHQAFIDANCDHSIEICPVTKRERQLADILTVMSMNEGMASTFVPFACKAEDGDLSQTSRQVD